MSFGHIRHHVNTQQSKKCKSGTLKMYNFCIKYMQILYGRGKWTWFDGRWKMDYWKYAIWWIHMWKRKQNKQAYKAISGNLSSIEVIRWDAYWRNHIPEYALNINYLKPGNKRVNSSFRSYRNQKQKIIQRIKNKRKENHKINVDSCDTNAIE